MKKNYLEKQNIKRLAGYSAMAAGLIAYAGVADAQISYTDVSPDQTFNSNGDIYDLDMDNDGVVDFEVAIVNSDIASAFYAATTGGGKIYFSALLNEVVAAPQGGNSIAGTFKAGTAGSYAYPYDLAAGNAISAGLAWNTLQYQSMIFYVGVIGYPAPGSTAVYLSSGNWRGASNKYLGLKFSIGGQKHYGWARLDCPDNASFTIKDYAYDTSPNAPLNAGQMPTGVTTLIPLDQVSAYSYGNTINLNTKNLTANKTSVKVYDEAGKVVYSNSLTNDNMVITLNNAATGYYVIKLEADGSVFNKKLYINE